MSVSQQSIDTGSSKDNLVKQEAILNCNDRKWLSFLCILGLSSVLQTNIFTYYPDCGAQRFKHLFNCMVQQRLKKTFKKGFDDFHILFRYDAIVQAGEAFQPNHFVPLLFYTHNTSAKTEICSCRIGFQNTKLAPILSKNVSKKPDTNISSFFKPTVNLTFHKAPNETFSSSAALRTHQNIDKYKHISQSINVNQKALLLALSLPLRKNLIILTILILLCIEINAKVWVLLSFVV